MVLILEPVTTEVKNISKIGNILIANKNSNFLSLRSNLNLIFLIKSQTKIKNGINNDVGLLINSSRGIIYAGTDRDFDSKSREAAEKIKNRMSNYL